MDCTLLFIFFFSKKLSYSSSFQNEFKGIVFLTRAETFAMVSIDERCILIYAMGKCFSHAGVGLDAETNAYGKLYALESSGSKTEEV